MIFKPLNTRLVASAFGCLALTAAPLAFVLFTAPTAAQSPPASTPAVVVANSSGTPAAPQRYQFYKVSDDRVQVFSDSQVIRILLGEGMPRPTLIAVRPEGEALLLPRAEGNYLVVDGLHARIELKWSNRKTITAVYQGIDASARAGQAASFGAVAPQESYSAAARPLDAVVVKPLAVPAEGEMLAVALKEVTEQLKMLRVANSSAVVMPTAKAEIVQAAPAIPKPEWKVDLADVYIANTLHRWGKTSGYRVKWDANKNFMVEAPDVYMGSFEEVVTSLLSAPGIQSSKYPLDVCFYPNNPPLARITLRGEQDKECK